MASHYHHHPYHHHHHHQPPPPPPSPPCTHCCCNPSPTTCCTTQPPPSQDHHFLLQTIASLLSQPQHPIATITPTHHHHYPKSHTFHSQTHQQYQHQTHSNSISSLLNRIESLESSFLSHHHHSLSSPSSSSSLSLRHAAARVIQTHFRSFLARRSRTLRHLKHLALIKSTFNSLKSSLSQNNTHPLDFPALSLKAFNLLLQLDSIEGCDPMILDRKKSITRDLVQFLDSIEGAAVKQRLHCVKSAKSGRFTQRVSKSRDSDDDERKKLLQNLRGRVERINKLCKISENGEVGFVHEGVHNVGGGDYDIYDDSDRVTNVVVGGRNEMFPKKNVFFVQRQGAQPRVKKSVTFAENGKICEVYSSGGAGTCEPDLSGDVVYLDGTSFSDGQGEVLENIGCAVEDDADPSQGDDEEEVLVENGGESPHSSDDGGRNPTRDIKNDGRNIVKGQIQTQQGKILFSAPMPLKMENKGELMKSKGVRILT